MSPGALVAIVGVVAIAAGVAAAVVGLALRGVGRDLRAMRDDAATLSLIRTFASASIEVVDQPRSLLVWHPLAAAARSLFPASFAALDRAFGRPFPFGPADADQAHARWTGQWLAWEAAHDAEYKLKAATLDEQLQHVTGERAALVRAQLAGVEREQLERYQQRYEEYVRVARAIAALGASSAPATPPAKT